MAEADSGTADPSVPGAPTNLSDQILQFLSRHTIKYRRIWSSLRLDSSRSASKYPLSSRNVILRMRILMPFARSYSMALHLRQYNRFLLLASSGSVEDGIFQVRRLGENVADIGVCFLPIIYNGYFSAASLQLIRMS
jgi:hypothetical protein